MADALDFFALARERFRFLEDDYGFELAAQEDSGWREELRYRNATTLVEVLRDFEYGGAVEVELAPLDRGGAAPPRERRLALDSIVAVRAESPLEAERAARRAESVEAQLDYWAEALRQNDELLRGDFSVEAEVDALHSRRFRLEEQIYLSLSRRGVDERAPAGAQEGDGVLWSMPTAEISRDLRQLEQEGRELTPAAVRRVVERHVRAWAPLRLRLRPGTARRIAEAADEIRSLWLERRDAHEPSRPAQPAPLAGFATSARRHFDFLLEHGFEVASENEASVSYRRGDVGIVVLLHDEFGFPFVKLHRLVDGRWPQAEEALLPALVPPGPAEAARRERLAPDADPETQLAADAGILKRWGGSLLDGDPSAIGAARDRERARPQLVDDVGKALVEHGLARERLGPAMSMVEKLERLRESGQTPAAADVYAQLPSHLRLRARLNPAERRRLRAAAAEIERLWSTYIEATAAGVTGT